MNVEERKDKDTYVVRALFQVLRSTLSTAQRACPLLGLDRIRQVNIVVLFPKLYDSGGR